jgi:hypothetical protein
LIFQNAVIQKIIFVGFEVIRMVIMKSSVFWDIAACSAVKVKKTFRRDISPQSSGFKRRPSKKQNDASSKHSLTVSLGLLFSLEDGSDLFL